MDSLPKEAFMPSPNDGPGGHHDATERQVQRVPAQRPRNRAG
ncbi:hypothetical protein GLE_5531 [Lysobacter enzymogenes]|uniref:Uncharacterized protein n=1 Tax=Lysobacter enzymogenes TaxID=69 RepID=A0A0S2DRQ7_LYSEN|nr:hypothetical protein GLE_5531 [Lysobacter enzymogenes]